MQNTKNNVTERPKKFFYSPGSSECKSREKPQKSTLHDRQLKKVALKRNLSILSKRRFKNNQKPNEKARKELTTQNGQIKRRRKRKEADHRNKEKK